MSGPINFPTIGEPLSKEPEEQPRLGEILMDLGQVSPNNLLKALVLQNQVPAKLGEILTARGLAAPTAVRRAIEHQSGLVFIELEEMHLDNAVVQILDVEFMVTKGCVVISQRQHVLEVALADPSTQEKVADHLAAQGFSCIFYLASTAEIMEKITLHAPETLVERAKSICPENVSCRGLLQPRKAIFFVVSLLCVIGAIVTTGNLLMFLLAWAGCALIGNTTFKLACLFAYVRGEKPDYTGAAPPRRGKLPRVSILVPLYNEAEIASRLVERMSKLDYPKELLEICLVCEADDTRTISHLRSAELPFWMRIVEVPHDTLRTKPRAMNFALDFCNGEIVGVYDAEDAPQANQIYKVVAKLQDARYDVACVQAALDSYNARSSWLSRCFTIEYAILFRVILRGLERMRLPIPLGGTSVFFRRDILEKVGRWDAHNVTEDADLGMRLARAGYRCELVDTVTYEEANDRLIPWIKQRSRWLKGFLLTWAVHMQHPIGLLRDLGLAGFLVFNILFLGTVTAFLMVPLVLPLWLVSFGVTLSIYDPLSGFALAALILAFLTTEFVLFLLGFFATRSAALRHLTITLPSMILYWPIGALAAYKAVWEIITNPLYWDKTQHGVNDFSYAEEISRLTAPTPESVNEKRPALLTASGG